MVVLFLCEIILSESFTIDIVYLVIIVIIPELKKKKIEKELLSYVIRVTEFVKWRIPHHGGRRQIN